jgi:hypothetical protein
VGLEDDEHIEIKQKLAGNSNTVVILQYQNRNQMIKIRLSAKLTRQRKTKIILQWRAYKSQELS